MLDAIVTEIRAALHELMRNNPNVIAAIDGRCASGKTSLSELLLRDYDCNLIHMDDFFLRPEQRSEERLRQPGENIDHERFLQEVLLPLRAGELFSYRPFDCHSMQMKPAVLVYPKPLCIIEGSYSCHAALRHYYDLRIFLTVEQQEQLRRITARNGQNAAAFVQKWIPLEERYFSDCHASECCELYYTT